MNKTSFMALLTETHLRMVNLTKSKGEEYSRDADQLANFYRNAQQVNASPFLVWFVYFNKHMDAIINYITHGHTLSESIESRIDDAILYLILLKGLAREKDHQAAQNKAIKGADPRPDDSPI